MEMMVEPKQYGIQEVFQIIGRDYLTLDTDEGQCESSVVVDGFDVYRISLRYETFYQKGTACVCCGKPGTHFKLCGNPNTNRRHFNLFADDGSLITKDHIIPKSKGGKDIVTNMQPMCEQCNNAKGNNYPEIMVEYIVATNEQTGGRMKFRSINKAAFHFLVHYLRPGKKDRDKIINTAIGAVLNIQSAIKNGTPYHGFIWTTEWM